MARRYGAQVSMSGINTADKAYILVWAPTYPLSVVELAVNIAAAPTNAPALYIARATARGTQASTLAGQPYDPDSAASDGTLDVCASATQPTFSTTNIFRGGGLGTSLGGFVVFPFYDVPIVVKPGNGLVLANAIASGSTLGTWKLGAIWDQ
jgi:hypothetical protein